MASTQPDPRFCSGRAIIARGLGIEVGSIPGSVRYVMLASMYRTVFGESPTVTELARWMNLPERTLYRDQASARELLRNALDQGRDAD